VDTISSVHDQDGSGRKMFHASRRLSVDIGSSLLPLQVDLHRKNLDKLLVKSINLNFKYNRNGKCVLSRRAIMKGRRPAAGNS